MTTQEMFDDEIHCSGRGFNCGNCKHKNECVEYVECPPIKIQPLGIISKKIWDEQRLDDIQRDIKRYSEASLEIPTEWLEELYELTDIQESED